MKKIITDKSYYYEVGHKFVAKSSPEQSKTITIRMDNKELKNSVIEDNSKLIADTLWKWRTPEVGKKGKISSQEKQQQEVAIAFQKAASSGDVATAEVNARKIFANIPAVISAID